MAVRITLEVNGVSRAAEVAPHLTLLAFLRDDLDLKGPKYGCGMAQCGACTVLMDDAPARACMIRASRANGARITTLEGLADPATGALHPVQQGFSDMQGAQCGYCLNGMVMTAVALLARDPAPDDAAIRAALRHNLCRCGTHIEIMASVRRAAELMRAGG